jgi:hypothetical protein
MAEKHISTTSTEYNTASTEWDVEEARLERHEDTLEHVLAGIRVAVRITDWLCAYAIAT